MTQSDHRNPYRPNGATNTRGRTTLIIVAAAVVVAVGLTLHLVGLLPPRP
jgi:hypothetical protein